MEKQSTAIPTSKNLNDPKVKANKALAIQLQAATLVETKDKKQKERVRIFFQNQEFLLQYPFFRQKLHQNYLQMIDFHYYLKILILMLMKEVIIINKFQNVQIFVKQNLKKIKMKKIQVMTMEKKKEQKVDFL